MGLVIPLMVILGLYCAFTVSAMEPTPIVVEQEFEFEPQVVQIGTKINWTPERIEEEIRNTFPEDSEIAIRIAKCESNLIADIVGPTSDYGIFQIHAPTWHNTAIELGYTNYKTDPQENIQMARHIYELAGSMWIPWVCYTKKLI